ncbi:hypothetical protein KIL84_009849 [Mauremys mutica]|uniref:Cadherin Y-type LIR-motif domain-containing protein n=2 Tax=Mauremys mutica TaxID=74926 RepID=A0A9D3XN16_9SAUR|nr:hypothetical protein KIL84_009849 [Mauremys mutica]
MAPAEQDEVRENIISYDDEGGGEADTQAFDMAALQRPPPPALPPGPPHLAACLAARLGRADADPRAPPYDSLQVYGYEGGGTPCGSLSPLGSSWGGSEGEGGDPGEWGPLFHTLAELYGGQAGPA